MNQGEFVHAAGIDNSSLNKYESGKTLPRTDTLMMICATLNVSSDYILFGKTEGKIEFTNAECEKTIAWKICDAIALLISEELIRFEKKDGE